jgi:hypothetical protein
MQLRRFSRSVTITGGGPRRYRKAKDPKDHKDGKDKRG